MSRVTCRGVLAALLIASVFAAPAATADAKSKSKCSKVTKAKGKKGKRCKKAKPKPKPTPATPVRVDLLDGSVATVEVPAIPLPGGYVIPGTPATRTVPISGSLKGGIPGGYRLGQDNDIMLTEGAITPGPIDVLSDPGCAGSPILRINPASTAVLDKVAPSAGKVMRTGVVTATVRVLLRLAFDSRTEPGCDKPLVTMGSAESLLPVTLSGKIEKGTGLTALTLDGAPVPLTASVCLTPGDPGQPCATPPVGYPIRIGVHTIVKIAVG